MTSLWRGLVLLWFMAESCFALSIVDVFPDETLQPLVDPTYGLPTPQWMGGDSSASILLDFGVREFSLFIYGDTVLGLCQKNGSRDMEHFIHNTIGVVEISSPTLSPIKKFWRVEPNVSAMFSPPESVASYYYWLMSMFSVVTSRDENSGFPLSYDVFIFSPNVLVNSTAWIGFDGVTILAIRGVTNQNIDNPLSWHFDRIQMPEWMSSESNGFLWGVASSVVGRDGKLYMLGNQGNQTAGVYLARMDVSLFLTLEWSGVEFFSSVRGGGEVDEYDWIVGDMSHLVVIPGAPNTPECTLTWNAALGKWLMIANAFLSFDAYLYYSDELWGPWDRVFLYHIPPPVSTTKDLFVYAFKIHPELSLVENEFVFTYNSNSFKFFDDEKNPLLSMMYIPQFVRVKFEKE